MIERQFFNLLRSNIFLILEVEDRLALGYKKYGDVTDAEYSHLRNPADGALWDAIVVGYEEPIPTNTFLISNDILGILMLSDGNHKIFPLVNRKGFNLKKAYRDISNYCSTYLDTYPKLYGDYYTKEEL